MAARDWVKKITSGKSSCDEYYTTGKECWERYNNKKTQHYNIFKANTDIQLGTLFNEMPNPDIRRRFTDSNNEAKEELYRYVSTVSDRCVKYAVDNQQTKKNISRSIKDGLITGRGVAYINYEFDEETQEQTTTIEHIPYSDYVEEVALKENDISWKSRQIPMTKKEVAEEFDVEESDLGTSLKVEGDSENSIYVSVWEVWDRKTKKRYYVSSDYKKDEYLREEEDPLGLEDFFPFETYKTIDNGADTKSTAEFEIYKELNNDLQDCVKRKGKLTKNDIKYRPLFDNSAGSDLTDAYSKGEGTATPVVGNPSVKILDKVGAIPTLEAQNIVVFLGNREQELIKEIWQVTGISDLMRGDSDARETATAQKQKGLYGGLRIKPKQEEIQEFIKNLYKKISEIVCEKYMIETLLQISCVDLPTVEQKQQTVMKYAEAQQMGQPQQPSDADKRIMKLPTIGEVAQVLRDDKLRSYSIDIETSATVFDDIQSQRQEIQAFTSGLFTMFDKTAQYVMQSPSIIDLMEQMTLLNISQYKVARSYTDSIKEVFSKFKQEIQAKNNAPQQPNPELLIKQEELKAKQSELQLKAQTEQAKSQAEIIKAQNEAQYNKAKIMQDQEKIRNDAINDAKKIAIDLMVAQDKQAQTDIDRQEQLRKDLELKYEVMFANRKLEQGESAIIAGSVAPIGNLVEG